MFGDGGKRYIYSHGFNYSLCLEHHGFPPTGLYFSLNPTPLDCPHFSLPALLSVLPHKYCPCPCTLTASPASHVVDSGFHPLVPSTDIKTWLEVEIGWIPYRMFPTFCLGAQFALSFYPQTLVHHPHSCWKTLSQMQIFMQE